MNRRVRRSTFRPMLALAALVTASACGGPDVPFDVAMKEVASDVVMGETAEKAPPVPLPPTALDVALTPRRGVMAPPRPPNRGPSSETSSPTTTRPPPPACPAADRHAAPSRAADFYVEDRPAAATYQYRNNGTITVAGVDASQDQYEIESTRTVDGVEDTADGFVFDVLATLGGTTTMTSYRVVREQPLPAQPGLYITAVTTTEEDGSVHRFTPSAPVTLLEFPAENGRTWTGVAPDAANGVTMRYQASIGPKQRVDACGALVDAVVVSLTGEIVQAATGDAAARFSATYAIATQYGGLVVMDDVDITRTHPSGSVNRRNKAVITREPEPGAAR